ncbi:MAG: hypothetical protein AAGF24_12195 [Cyanobacteria bacterium P01_H01_bin.121]
MTTDQIIAKLAPGQSAEISRVGETYCTVERTGNGNTIKFVRHTPSGFTVFRTRQF